jgi:disulfide bond formation protein DsbB
MEDRPNSQETDATASGVAALVVLMIFFGFMLWLLLDARPNHPGGETVAQVSTEAIQPSPTKLTSLPTEVPPAGYSGEIVSQGSSYFGATCSGCHGSDARGIQGLGKNLVESEFVDGLSDDELHDFIITGRSPFDPANTTGIEMPARGGNPALTDDNIYQIIAYLRTQADPSLMVASGPNVVADSQTVPTETPDRPTATAVEPTITVVNTATIVPAETQPPTPTVEFVPHVFSPAEAYNLSCAGCHGVDGEGVPANGPALTNSALLMDPQGLRDFLITGNPDADVPGGEFSHPVRGSYPVLDDEELQEVIYYLITLNAGLQ